MKVCFCASTDGERSFHLCRGPVKLVQACLFGGNTLQRYFNRGGGVMAYVQFCLCASTHRESSFQHGGGPVMLVQACLIAGNTLQCHFNRG